MLSCLNLCLKDHVVIGCWIDFASFGQVIKDTRPLTLFVPALKLLQDEQLGKLRWLIKLASEAPADARPMSADLVEE